MAQVNNSLVKSQGQQKLGFTAYITQDGVKNQIANVLGSDKGQIFVSSIVSSVNTNPQLAECTNSSIVSAALLGASLNLSPSPQLGQFYMLPFNDRNRGKVAEFVLGYHGMIQLAIRSGYYKRINVLEIKEGELVSFDSLTEDIEVNLISDPDEREAAKTIGYYAMFEYLNGFRKAMYWSRAKMMRHADRYSKAFSAAEYEKLQRGEIPERDMWKYSSFWYNDFDAMAKKTMLRQLISHWGAMSTELQDAIIQDDQVMAINENGDGIEAEMEDAVSVNTETGEVTEEPVVIVQS
jgi:recombination protein RecT